MLANGVRPQVDFRAHNAGMAEPQGDLVDILRGFQVMDGRGVPQHVRKDTLPGDGWDHRSSCTGMHAKAMRESMAAHRLAPGIQEQVMTLDFGTNLKLVTDHFGCLLPEWQDTLFATFPRHYSVNGIVPGSAA